jgi:hypothetical protein
VLLEGVSHVGVQTVGDLPVDDPQCLLGWERSAIGTVGGALA